MFKVSGVAKCELGCTIKKYLLGVFLTTGAKYDGIDEKDIKGMNAYAAEHFGVNGGIAQQYLFYYIRGLDE